MAKHSRYYKEIRSLRRLGKTYSQINKQLGMVLPKSTLSYICKDISLTMEQVEHIQSQQRLKLAVSRKKAVLANKAKFNHKVAKYKKDNISIGKALQYNRDMKLVALAMLYLGEGAKWKGHRGLMLGSSDPNIIRLYITLLNDCYGISTDRMKCRIQHRADQNSSDLIQFWSTATNIHKDNFYPCYIDKRPNGQRTKKADYRGVCTVTCAGTHIQLELDQIARIIFEAI